MDLSSRSASDYDHDEISMCMSAAAQRTKTSTNNARKKAKRAAKRLILITEAAELDRLENPSAAQDVAAAASDAAGASAHPHAATAAARFIATTSSASASATAGAAVEMTEVQKFQLALERDAAFETPEERFADKPYIDDLVRRLNKFGVERTPETVLENPMFSRSRTAAMISSLRDPEDAELRLTLVNLLEIFERHKPYFLCE
jgi:hypothetical protein